MNSRFITSHTAVFSLTFCLVHIQHPKKFQKHHIIFTRESFFFFSPLLGVLRPHYIAPLSEHVSYIEQDDNREGKSCKIKH